MYLMKRVCIFLLAALIMSMSVSAAGDTSDPAISKSYLDSVFSGEFLRDVSAATSKEMNTLEAETLQELESKLAASKMQNESKSGVSYNGSGSLYTAQADRVSVVLGTKITLVDGSVTAGSAGWVDVTVGEAVKKDSSLQTGHTYISTEENCAYVTNSIVGCVSYNGGYTMLRSGSTDYASRAQALAALGLFKGGTTGFELNRAATRTEALVMFLRILGLENEALLCTAANPFWDIPSWASQYAAYAYEQGLAQGRGGGTYDANTYVTAQDYLTFLLRSLGYKDNADFTWANVLNDAVKLNLITDAERVYFQTHPFTRGHMAYLSWQALMTQTDDGQLMLCRLRDERTVTREQIATAIQMICGNRIS